MVSTFVYRLSRRSFKGRRQIIYNSVQNRLYSLDKVNMESRKAIPLFLREEPQRTITPFRSIDTLLRAALISSGLMFEVSSVSYDG